MCTHEIGPQLEMHLYCSRAIGHLYITCIVIRLHMNFIFFISFSLSFFLSSFCSFLLSFVFLQWHRKPSISSCYNSNNFKPHYDPRISPFLKFYSLFHSVAPIVHDVHRQWVSSHPPYSLPAHGDSQGWRRCDSPSLLSPWQILFHPVIYIYSLTPSLFIARELFSFTSVGFESSLYNPHMYPTGIY